MNLQEITDAVDAGKTVHWGGSSYQVTRGCLGGLFVECLANGSLSPLSGGGVGLLYPESEFFLAEPAAAPEKRVWLLDLRATCLVDAVDAADARTAWEEGLEYNYEIDQEGGILRREIYEDVEPRPEGSPGEMVYSLTADEVNQIVYCMEASSNIFDFASDDRSDCDAASYRSVLEKLSVVNLRSANFDEPPFKDFSSSMLGN